MQHPERAADTNLSIEDGKFFVIVLQKTLKLTKHIYFYFEIRDVSIISVIKSALIHFFLLIHIFLITL